MCWSPLSSCSYRFRPYINALADLPRIESVTTYKAGESFSEAPADRHAVSISARELTIPLQNAFREEVAGNWSRKHLSELAY
jgi:hypothetical protein